MADGTVASPTGPMADASDMHGTIYVIDLIGFSQMTEARMAKDARRGTEAMTRLVSDLFTQLMHALSERDIQFGGIAGDALIAWQPHRAKTISGSDFNTLATSICDMVWPELKCRTAMAEGQFWLGKTNSDDRSRPLLWGPAISAAFDALEREEKPKTEASPVDREFKPTPEGSLATATVVERWSIVFRMLSPSACQTATPYTVGQSLERVKEICEAFSAKIDNVVQDDKGLLVIIVLPPSPKRDQNTRENLIRSLTMGREPLASSEELRSRYGTVFRYRLIISDQAITITVGRSINEAAKALAQCSETVPVETTLSSPNQSLSAPITIGRELENAALLKSLDASHHQIQATGLIGPAGIGKTTIIQALRSVTAQSHRLIEVTPGSRYLPFGAAQDLAEACGLSASVVFDTSGQDRLARALPQTLILENWQWCDRDSKRLIRRLHEGRSSGLLLVSSRQHIDGLPLNTQIDVAPFEIGQSDELLETIAPQLLSESAKRSLYDVTSGNPFWLVQAGLHYATKPHAPYAVSSLSGLEALLNARAESLSRSALALWRLFCAWRRPIAFDRAKDLLRRFDVSVSNHEFEELSKLGWIASEDSSSGAEFRPAHDILADWGLSDIPVSFEHLLHSTIARALASEHGSPSRIARHWQKAEKNLRAAVWYDRAAIAADRAGAHALTREHLRSAASLSKSAKTINQERVLDHLARSATALWGVGKLRQAKQTLLEFDATARKTRKSERKSQALLRAATIQSEVGQFAANSKLMTTGILRGWRYRGQDGAAYEVKARRQGFIYYALGLMRLPIDSRLTALVNSALHRGEYRSQAILGCSLATLNMIRCEWEKAEQTLQSCYAGIAQTDDRQMLGVVQCLLGLCHLYQGQSTAAHKWFDRVSETGREQDHHMFQVWGAYAKAEAHLYAGEWRAAKTLALEARTNAVGLGDHQSVCIIEGTLAQVHAIEQDFEPARSHARNAMRFAVRIPPTNFSTLEGIAAPAQVGVVLQQMNRHDREIDQMIQTGRKALKKYAQTFRMAQPRYLYVEGLVAGAKGNAQAAQRFFNKAHDRAEALGMRYEQNLAISALTAIQETPHGATA